MVTQGLSSDGYSQIFPPRKKTWNEDKEKLWIVSLLSAAFEYKSLLASTLVVERTPQEIRLHILKLEIRTDKNNIIGAQHMELLTVLLMAKVPGV